MRLIPFIFLIIMLVGCSSGNVSIMPTDEIEARIVLSEPYFENGDLAVDVLIENVESLYQFSMRLEYNPQCVEIIGFEPSDAFGFEPIMLCEPVRNIPDNLKSDMGDSSNSLIAIAVSLRDQSKDDIKQPNSLGRLRFRLKCDSVDNASFKIFNNGDYLVFRDRMKNRIRVRAEEMNQRNHRGGR